MGAGDEAQRAVCEGLGEADDPVGSRTGHPDVGLAKACRRHAVPAPPRGYWAKLKAGQKPPQTPLPTPELDVIVQFATSDPEERERQKVMERKRAEALKAGASAALENVAAQFSEHLDDAHPLVKATQRYCDRIPKIIEQYKRRGADAWRLTKEEDRPPSDNHGRYSLLHHGLLDITASLEAMDWVLQFHASIFRGLVAGGMVIARREAPTGRPVGRSDGPAIEARFKGETFTIQFSQGYRRVYLDSDELAKKRKEHSWAREYENRPSEKLSFSISGTEHRASKTWQGAQEKLQGQVDEIVRTAFQLVPLQVELRKEREAAAAVAKREEDIRALERRRKEARAEQLKQAFLMMEADERVRRLKDFLAQLDQMADGFRPPYDERAKVWVQVVTKELAARNPMEEILQQCLSVPSWKTWPPDWWPAEPDAHSASDTST